MKKNEVKVGNTYMAKVSDKVVPVRIDAEHPSGGWRATNMTTEKQVRVKSAQRLRGPAPRTNAAANAKPVPKAEEKREPKTDTPTTKPFTKPAMANITIRPKGRVSAATRTDRAALLKAIAELVISNGHIAFGKNGAIYELYFREHNGSPAMWKAKASTPLDDLGYRSEGATMLYTGVDAVRDGIKTVTGRTPSAIGISLGKWQRSDVTKKTASAKPKKLSLIDAAAQVLAASGGPLNCKQIVEQVAAKGLWTSTAATPHATLYSAILREIQKKGAAARFTKVDRGSFTLTPGSNAAKQEA